jgi:hypothetical protein
MVNGAVNTASQEAACVQSQTSNPDPNSGDTVCKTVGTAVTRANELTRRAPDQSDSCVSPQAKTVFDGFAGQTYAKLMTDQPTAQDTAVCYRIDQGTTFEPGGRLDIQASGVSVPTTDTSYNACSTTGGNTFPSQHPLFSTSGPPLGTDMIDVYTDSGGDAWLCLEADPIGKRVLAKEPNASGLPSNTLDSPQVPAPPPTPGPVGYPSTTCQSGSGNVQALDANIGGVQAWLYGWQETSTKVHLCVRAQTPAQNPSQSAGGEITVDATGVPGVTPVVPTISSNTSACTQTIRTLTVDGVTVTVSSSPSSANPATVCVTSTALPQPVAITAGFTGGAGTPHVNWTPDPGTPGGSIGNINLL